MVIVARVRWMWAFPHRLIVFKNFYDWNARGW